ncbi:MAG: ribonuclease Z [Gemmataceae bacterium]|nr:ribonuclease Z [Gemmataceae bacterium]
MSIREAVFLGTASEVPTRARNHNAVFLFWDDLGILFDPGEGTQRQMIHAGIAAAQITHIAITHFHGDHCLGLAGVVQRLSLDRVAHPVEVIYPQSGQVYFERLRNASIFYDAATLVPRPVEGAGGEIEVCRRGSVRLVAHALEHGIDCFGYRLQEDAGRRMVPELLDQAGVRGPAVGLLQRKGEITVGGKTVRLEEVSVARPGQGFALVMDTRPCEGAARLAHGADLLVCESTYLSGEAQEAHDHYHMTARDAAELAHIAGARRLAVTHFSQRYPSGASFAEEAALIHADVVAADDLARVPLPKRSA